MTLPEIATRLTQGGRDVKHEGIASMACLPTQSIWEMSFDRVPKYDLA